MFKTIIVDDEKGCRDTLENLLQEIPEINVVAIVDSIALAQEAITNLQPQ